jgi:hypothetical protein
MVQTKEETKHAPTPWEIDESGFLRPTQQVCKEDGHYDCAVAQVCWVTHLGGYHRANAEFILTAVNNHDSLLAACLRAVDYINESNVREVTLEEAVEIRELLVAAIAKANVKE